MNKLALFKTCSLSLFFSPLLLVEGKQSQISVVRRPVLVSQCPNPLGGPTSSPAYGFLYLKACPLLGLPVSQFLHLSRTSWKPSPSRMCSLQHHCALVSWGSENFLFFCASCWGVQTTDEQRSYSLFPSLLVHRKSENDKGKGSSIRVPYVEGEEIFRGNRLPRHYLKTLRTTVSPDKCIDWEAQMTGDSTVSLRYLGACVLWTT